MNKPFRGTDGNQFQHNFKNTYLNEGDLTKPTREVSQQIAEHTQKELNNLIFQKTNAAYVFKGRMQENIAQSDDHYIKYTPNNEAGEKIIKMQSIKQDPMEPARFRHKRIPRGPASPQPIMMRSPPRKLTVKDQLDWKIPPCISNWKNAKGYTIPLEMRLSADGRSLQHHTVNSKFAQLTDGLYIAERQSRKELEERNKIMKSIAFREHQEKEEELRKKAASARQTKNQLLENQVGQANEDDDEAKARDELRYIRNRELQSQMRQELNKKSKNNRDESRDISEKVALGQAQATTQEFAYDQRLFNQQSGVSAGFAGEDDYDVYDKPLFHDRSSVYKMAHARPQEDEANTGRNKPVEFEKNQEDIFGMDSFITDTITKKVKK